MAVVVLVSWFTLWQSKRRGLSGEALSTTKRYVTMAAVGMTILLLVSGVFLSGSPMIARLGRLILTSILFFAGCAQCIATLRLAQLRARSPSQMARRARTPPLLHDLSNSEIRELIAGSLLVCLAIAFVWFQLSVKVTVALFAVIPLVYAAPGREAAS
jgi:hypothetical protein